MADAPRAFSLKPKQALVGKAGVEATKIDNDFLRRCAVMVIGPRAQSLNHGDYLVYAFLFEADRSSMSPSIPSMPLHSCSEGFLSVFDLA